MNQQFFFLKEEMEMHRVVIESPYAADTEEGVEKNLAYLRACMNDCFKRNEAPFASHGLYTQKGVLNDRIPEERRLGILAGFIWADLADARVVYLDLGMTDGMKKGIRHADKIGQPVEYRRLYS